jgi:hypothetical protein
VQTAFQLGLRYGLIIGIMTMLDIYAGTMTTISRTTWMFAQTVLGLLTMYLCGWTGLKAFKPSGERLWLSGLAGGLAGLTGTMLFTFTLFTVVYGLTDRLQQFPFASVDFAKKGLSVAEYVRSADGARDLWNMTVAGLLRAPLGAGFGAIGGLISRSVGMIKDEN